MPLSSMTGFGSARIQEEGLELAVEMKTVNNRFLDVNLKLPPAYSCFEAELSRVLRDKLRRGRLDVFVYRRCLSSARQTAVINGELYEAYLREIRKVLPATGSDVFAQAASAILMRREVLDSVAVEEDVTEEQGVLEKAVYDALEKLIEMRQREGAELEKELHRLLKELEKKNRIRKENS